MLSSVGLLCHFKYPTVTQTHRLHVVDERVALVPGTVIVTTEGHGPEVHMLVGLGQKLDAIVDQGHAVGQGAGHCGGEVIRTNVIYHFQQRWGAMNVQFNYLNSAKRMDFGFA